MKARIGPGACREEARSLRLRSPCVEAGGVGHPCRRGAAQEVRGCGPLGVAPAAPARRRKLQAQADRGRPEVRTTDQSSCNPPSSQEKLARLNRSGQTRSQPKPAWSPRVQRGAMLIRSMARRQTDSSGCCQDVLNGGMWPIEQLVELAQSIAPAPRIPTPSPSV